MTTEKYQFQELTSAQADKFVTYNRNLRRLEAMSTSVVSRTNGGPPVSPVEGDAYIVDSLTGDWSSTTLGYIAHYALGVWRFYVPFEGTRVHVNDEDILVKFDGTNWVNLASTDTGLAALTDNSVPFLESGLLIEDVNFNYDPDTDTLTVPNLNVTGTVTTIDTTNLDITDSIISLANGNTTDALDIGILGERLTSNIALFYDESADEWSAVTTSSTSSDTTLTITDYANFHAGQAIFDDYVGIGATPTNPLHIDADDTAVRIVRGSSIGFLYNTGTSATDLTRLQGNGGGVELYAASGQPVNLNVNGTVVANVVSAGLGIGKTATTSLDVVGVTRTSTYFSANDVGYIRGDNAGELRLQGGSTSTAFYNNANTVELAKLLDGGQFQFSAGTAAAPGISFRGATSDGILSQGSGQFDLVASSTSIIRLSASGVFQISGGYLNLDGTASTPSYTFGNDQDTGMYRTGADTLGLSTAGTEALRIDSSQNVSLAKELSQLNNQAHFFKSTGSANDLGLKSDTSNNLTFRTGGSWDRMVIDSSGNVGVGVTPTNSMNITRSVAVATATNNTYATVNLANATASYTAGNVVGSFGFSKSGSYSSGMRAGMVGVYTATGTEASNVGIYLSFKTSANAGGDSVEHARISPPSSGETALYVYDADNATLERVTVGAADSGGSGFKCLRIPN